MQRLGCDDGVKRAYEAMAVESEQGLVAGDQVCDLAFARDFEKFLVIRIPARGERTRCRVRCFDLKTALRIARENTRLPFRAYGELPIGEYAPQLFQGVSTCHQGRPSLLDELAQTGQRRVLEEPQCHYGVCIEGQS